MMPKIFQVDAFTQKVFGGNPAAVVPLDSWIDDTILQNIAAENNLAETAFVVRVAEGWELRWFTPVSEVALCGHATLATAHVLVNHLGCEDNRIEFHTRQSGILRVEKQQDGKLTMSFPAIKLSDSTDSESVGAALSATPTSLLQGSYSANEFDYLAVFNTQAEVAGLAPDFSSFRSLASRGVIATAPGDAIDFVSRYFAPNLGVDEDPVTGSAHCLLIPYWADELGKQQLTATQISKRIGNLDCALESEDRVAISGYAVDYLVGQIDF